jgi:hypothetical protein
MDQLRADKTSIERKLQDAEMQLKAIDDGHRQVPTAFIRNNEEEEEDDDDNDENLNVDRNKNGFHNDDDPDQLSDTDSDVVEMERTLKELRQTQLEYMSLLPTSNRDEKKNSHLKITPTVDLTKLSVADVGPVIRNIRTMNRSIPRMYESFETIPPNQLLTDTGRWSNSMISTLGNTNSLLMYQTLNRYQPNTTTHWSSQPSLVTREAVLKAARTVFSPGVIDQLNSNRKSSTH